MIRFPSGLHFWHRYWQCTGCSCSGMGCQLSACQRTSERSCACCAQRISPGGFQYRPVGEYGIAAGISASASLVPLRPSGDCRRDTRTSSYSVACFQGRRHLEGRTDRRRRFGAGSLAFAGESRPPRRLGGMTQIKESADLQPTRARRPALLRCRRPDRDWRSRVSGPAARARRAGSSGSGPRSHRSDGRVPPRRR